MSAELNPKAPAPAGPPVEKETPSKSAAAEALRQLASALDRTEKTTGRSGAVSRAPKQRMYNIEKLKAANPDKHYRYVNVADDEKAQARLDDGYKAVSETEAAKYGARSEIGSTKLMEIPREVAEARRREIDETTRHRLKAHERDVREAVEGVTRELRDRHGLNIPVERLLVDE